ncbi:unnamed protein product, partial [Rotaria socialis]
SQMMTRAPCRAKRLAQARPKPAAPPVMSTVKPFIISAGLFNLYI